VELITQVLLVCSLLQAYASIFNLLQEYGFKLAKSSSLDSRILSVMKKRQHFKAASSHYGSYRTRICDLYDRVGGQRVATRVRPRGRPSIAVRFQPSGKGTMLPSSPPLRTAHESFPSSSSSLSNALERTRLHLGVPLAMQLLMAGWMQQHAIFELIPSSF
jgi:hypothetical protein